VNHQVGIEQSPRVRLDSFANQVHADQTQPDASSPGALSLSNPPTHGNGWGSIGGPIKERQTIPRSSPWSASGSILRLRGSIRIYRADFGTPLERRQQDIPTPFFENRIAGKNGWDDQIPKTVPTCQGPRRQIIA